MIFFLFLLISFDCCAGSIDSNWIKEQVKEVKKSSSFEVQGLKEQFPMEELNPENKTFDEKKAKEQTLTQTIPDSEEKQFLESKNLQNNLEKKGFDESESFLNSPIVENNTLEIDNGVEYDLKTCRVSGEDFPLTYTRDLTIDVQYVPEKTITHKICKEHKESKKCSSNKVAKEIKEEWFKALSKDVSIKFFNIKIKQVGTLGSNTYKVTKKYSHKNDQPNCDCFENHTEILQKEEWKEVSEEWIDSNKDPRVEGADCTLLEKKCLDANNSKNINGKIIHRKCWKEQISFICKCQKINECSFLKAKNCDLVSEKCLKMNAMGCELWEKTFKCFSKFNVIVPDDLDDIYGAHGEFSEESKDNETFAEVASKLAILKEMGKEIAEFKDIDIKSIKFFSGNKFKCEKSISSDLIYDCCFSYSGFATNVNLAKCSSDEVHLGTLRQEGKCHYCGKFKEKILGVKTKDVHTFCCFPSKLARILNEQAKIQLGISWGKAKSPDCGGLLQSQIEQLDFSKLDLSELYDDCLENIPGMENKIEKFELSFQEKNEELNLEYFENKFKENNEEN